MEQKLLYIDIMNYASKFININNWDLKYTYNKIKKFVIFSRKSGITIKVFIDAGIETHEGMKKWKKRRENEIITEKKNMPQSMSVLLGDIFRKFNIEVYYSYDKDNDDTIAFYANKDNANILSQDKDFFRYQNFKYIVYKNFYYKNNKLILTKHEDCYTKSSKRLIKECPKLLNEEPSLVYLKSKHIYIRGTVTPLVKYMGNPHITIRPLRQALYYHLNINELIYEEFPIWDNINNKVSWKIEYVKSNDKYKYLLDKPEDALEEFFPIKKLIKPSNVDNIKWNKHLFGIKTLVFEICCLATKKCLYDELTKTDIINDVKKLSIN